MFPKTFTSKTNCSTLQLLYTPTVWSPYCMAQARAPRPSGLGWLRRHMDQWAFNRPAACAPSKNIVSGPSVRGKLGPHIDQWRFALLRSPLYWVSLRSNDPDPDPAPDPAAGWIRLDRIQPDPAVWAGRLCVGTFMQKYVHAEVRSCRGTFMQRYDHANI